MAYQREGTPTDLLYLADQAKLGAEAMVVSIGTGDRGIEVILDRTPFYAKRGGQPGDKGTIQSQEFSIIVQDVVFNDSGQVVHVGQLTGRMPERRDDVTATVNPSIRRLHSLWHSAGEALIVAAKMASFDEPVIGAIHYGPSQNRIEYHRRLPKDKVEGLKSQLMKNLANIVQDDTAIEILNLTDKNEIIQHCGFWPDYLPEDGLVRVVQMRPDYTGRPCTGTHLARTSELGTVVVDKIKVKGDKTIVSYSCLN